MFPTAVEQQYQQRNRRRGRNDPNNRDYICPCGKSYLSYPALFTHIKTKHNGRAPGQIIKPKPENNRRGRPKAREVYDSDSQTEDIASNSLDRLCDYVLTIEPEKPEESLRLKQIYQKDPFYKFYASYNQQQQEPKYNDTEDLYEETCENVFSEFLAEVHKKLNEPFYVDILFVFIVMLARGISKKNKSDQYIKEQPIHKIVDYINKFLLETLPQFKQKEKVSDFKIFDEESMAKLLEFFYNWLTMKKYLAVRIKINRNFFQAEE